MKKPIIRNWIKYWTTTIAVSGMLVVGACGDSNESAENETVTTETEVAAPVQEPVANTETEEETTMETENLETERTSNTRSAARMPDMDAHLEEHREVNERITEVLTSDDLEGQDNLNNDANQQGNNQTTPQGNNQTTQQNNQQNSQQEGLRSESEEQDTATDGNTYDRQSNTQMEDQQEQDGTSTGQDASYGQRGNNDAPQQTTTSDQQNYTPDEEQQNMENQGESEQTGTNTGTPTGNNNQQTGSTEYETDRQGTTQMEMQNDTQGEQQDATMGNQTEGTNNLEGTNGTEQDTERINQEGTETEMNDDQRNDQSSQSPTINQNQEGNNSTQYQEEDQQQVPNNNQQMDADPTQQQNRLDTNEQDTASNIYDPQSNTDVEDPDAVIIRLEQYTADYDEESRQRLDEAVNEYNTRRESMRGQMDPETGAYASPEIDPQPNVGVDQLLDQIQESLEYPQNAAAAEIQGTIFVNFIVDENGNVTNAEAKEQNVIVPPTSTTTPGSALDPTTFTEQEIEEAKNEMKEEAVKAVEQTSGQWIPAQHEGENVKAELQLPVVFDIQNIGAAAGDDPVNTQE